MQPHAKKLCEKAREGLWFEGHFGVSPDSRGLTFFEASVSLEKNRRFDFDNLALDIMIWPSSFYVSSSYILL